MSTDQPGSRAPLLLRFWIVWCAFCACTGWLLSLVGELNRAGYGVAVLVGAAVMAGMVVRARTSTAKQRPRARRDLTRVLKRWFTRLFPACFLVLAGMAFVGGCLYAPSNPDGLTHRVPRLLNWLAAEQWHWIENAPASFNTRATGFEWLMAPLVAVLKTDRLVFLLNTVSYGLMPGLVYSVFWRLGVRRRVAWYWMWLVPTGYCFLLQAGSIGNDLAGAVLALAAMDFGLRARESRRFGDVAFSVMAAALMTNAKASNLTLLLPWALALAPSVRVLLAWPLATAGIAVVASAVSLGPNTYFNIKRTGDWSGSKVEAPTFSRLTPGVAFAGNALNLTAQNFVPPIFPAAGWWNEHVYRWLPNRLQKRLEESFEPGGAHVQLMEMQLEVAAGLGFGVCVLVVVSLIAVAHIRDGPAAQTLLKDAGWLRLVRWSAVVSLLAYMVTTGLSTSARLIAPYYCLLLPVFLAGAGQSQVVRLGWWRPAGCGVFVLAGLLLAMNPGRPLWPAGWVFGKLAAASPKSGVLGKAAMLYETYSTRWDALAGVRQHLPMRARNVGFISFISASSIETSLWRPFGERRIWWLRPTSSHAEMVRKKIEYVVVGTDGPAARKWDVVFADWFAAWVRRNGGRVITERNVQLLATGAANAFYVVRIDPNVARAEEGRSVWNTMIAADGNR